MAPGRHDDTLRTDPETGDAVTRREGEPRPGPAGEGELKSGALVGRYLLVAQLGVGGMGQVWSAYDPQLERKVAIKLLHPGLGLEGEAGRAQLMAEAQAMAKLSHPNVLPIYDVGLWRDQVFLAMEFADAGDLKQWLKDARRPTRKVLQVFLAAGRGLAAAHAAKMVHRDFKEANVLLARDGAVRVADFGVASTEALARAQAGDPDCFAGTMGFAAPEVVQGGAASPLSDQFAFCVALWRGLFEALPYPARTKEQFLDAVGRGLPATPPTRRVPRRVVRALARGLSADPKDRFPSMAALLDQLGRDRLQALERRALPLASLVLASAFVAAAAFYLHRDATRCAREAGAAAGQAWSRADREAISRTFAQAGQPEAAKTAQGSLDAWFAEWKAHQAAACEAARAAPGDAQALMCLQRRLAQARGLVATLGRPGANLADSLGAALEGAERPADCARAPKAPLQAETAELRALRAASMECVTSLRFQRYADALACAPALVDQARRLEARPELADLLGVLAVATWAVKGPEGVLPTYRDAVRAADASGIAELSANARHRVAFFLLESEHHEAEAEQQLLDAEVWIDRAGRPPRLVERGLRLRADLAARLGRIDEALLLARQNLELMRELHGPASRAYASAVAEVGLALRRARRLEEAEKELLASLGILERDPSSPAVERAVTAGNLAMVRFERGRFDQAWASVEKAAGFVGPQDESAGTYSMWVQLMRAIVAEHRGRPEVSDPIYEAEARDRAKLDGPNQAEALAGRARSLLRQGKPAEALALAREANRLAAPSDVFSVAMCRFALAQALWANGERAEALMAGRESAKLLEAPEDAFWRGRMAAWLAEREREGPERAPAPGKDGKVPRKKRP